MGIALDTPEIVTKYIGSLHNYIRHSLLLFKPTTIDVASVNAIHIENRGKYDNDDQSKRTTAVKRREAKPSCTHCGNEGHDEENCWKLHPELRPERNHRNGKQKVVATI